ncbi:mitochondrial fission protein ELM1 [Nocardia sp. GAS34]|uniref:hypothetical protein n=1 Tax=unclassified Nocardia TaxID=2637762 RepID=UPI003D1EB174
MAQSYNNRNVDRGMDLRRAEETMEILRFSEYARERVAALSGGTRHKLNLTVAVMHDPQVLLLHGHTRAAFPDLASPDRRGPDSQRSTEGVSCATTTVDRAGDAPYFASCGAYGAVGVRSSAG